MNEINRMFLANLQTDNYWHGFEHDPDFSNAPKEPGEYKVLIKFPLSCTIMETEAIWNSVDWIVPVEGDEITPMVIGWRKDD